MLSRLGVCSRSEAVRRIAAGRVCVNGRPVRDPEMPADPATDRIELDGAALRAAERLCIVLNKPRGLVVSASDERGRDTVYSLLRDAGLPWLAPVGRLDRASEGLLLMGNDPAWAARITESGLHALKTYRVQVRGVMADRGLRQLRAGVLDRGEHLSARSIHVIGGGAKNTWLEIVLAGGRNRQIRRMLAACGYDVLRLIRVAIGPLQLGDLAKGNWRRLSPAEIMELAGGEVAAEPPIKPAASTRRSRFPLREDHGRRR